MLGVADLGFSAVFKVVNLTETAAFVSRICFALNPFHLSAVKCSACQRLKLKPKVHPLAKSVKYSDKVVEVK